MKKAGKEPGDGYLLEFTVLGGYVKVNAVDPVTATEVSIVGDANAPRQQLEKIAVRKLEYVLRRKDGIRE